MIFKKLITKINKPIVSTSANISGNPTPNSFKEIETDILKGVDYVVNLPEFNSNSTPSRIIKILKLGKSKIVEMKNNQKIKKTINDIIF